MATEIGLRRLGGLIQSRVRDDRVPRVVVHDFDKDALCRVTATAKVKGWPDIEVGAIWNPKRIRPTKFCTAIAMQIKEALRQYEKTESTFDKLDPTGGGDFNVEAPMDPEQARNLQAAFFAELPKADRIKISTDEISWAGGGCRVKVEAIFGNLHAIAEANYDELAEGCYHRGWKIRQMASTIYNRVREREKAAARANITVIDEAADVPPMAWGKLTA